MGFPRKKIINYPGWVTFIDGRIEKIIHAFKIGDNYVEVFTENGHRYSYERLFELSEKDMRNILPTHKFSKFENDRWLVTNDIREFSFDTNSVKED